MTILSLLTIFFTISYPTNYLLLLTYYPTILLFLFFSFFFFPFYTFMYFIPSFTPRALIAQSVEHGANNARVVGSSPTGSIFYLFFLFYDYPFLTYYLFYYLLSY